MIVLPRKTILVSAVLVSVVVISVAFSAPPERKFKNLKVLPKNISDKELDSVMHTYTRGLGVKCDFCHAPGADSKLDFASDAKPEKGIARKMIKMNNKINKKYFDYAKDNQNKPVQVMTCYSCHHGQEHPAKNPPPRQRPQTEGQPNQEAPKQ